MLFRSGKVKQLGAEDREGTLCGVVEYRLVLDKHPSAAHGCSQCKNDINPPQRSDVAQLLVNRKRQKSKHQPEQNEHGQRGHRLKPVEVDFRKGEQTDKYAERRDQEFRQPIVHF